MRNEATTPQVTITTNPVTGKFMLLDANGKELNLPVVSCDIHMGPGITTATMELQIINRAKPIYHALQAKPIYMMVVDGKAKELKHIQFADGSEWAASHPTLGL